MRPCRLPPWKKPVETWRRPSTSSGRLRGHWPSRTKVHAAVSTMPPLAQDVRSALGLQAQVEDCSAAGSEVSGIEHEEESVGIWSLLPSIRGILASSIMGMQRTSLMQRWQPALQHLFFLTDTCDRRAALSASKSAYPAMCCRYSERTLAAQKNKLETDARDST